MEIDPNKAINYITQNAGVFAKAKADRTFVENNLRVVKSELMNQEEGTLGNKEAYSYAHPRYKQQLEALREATQLEEEMLWQFQRSILFYLNFVKHTRSRMPCLTEQSL